jgi:hypothetical protein
LLWREKCREAGLPGKQFILLFCQGSHFIYVCQGSHFILLLAR